MEQRAAWVLLFSASLWGLSWWPLQRLAAAGVQGPAMGLLSYGVVGLAGLPYLWRARAQVRQHAAALALMTLVGGWAAASFIIMLSLGDVVREMLFFYLAPAWQVLGARLVLGEHLDVRRGAALALAMAGAFLVILAGGPLGGTTLTTADGIAISSGIAFAGNNLAARAVPGLPVTCKMDAVMLGCAGLSGLAMAVTAQPLPILEGPTWLGVLGFAFLWTFLGTWTTSYGVTHLAAGRAVILLLSELVVSVVSVSLIQQRVPTVLEAAGGVLILGAALIDALGGDPTEGGAVAAG